MVALRRGLVAASLASLALLASSGAGGHSLAVPSPTQVVAGNEHSCALLSSGEVMCWGGGEFGVLGNGSTDGSPTPVAVSGISDATAIAAGNFFNCALLSSGAVKCWGENTYGELGNGTTDDSSTPVSVTGISGAQAISTGLSTACAIVSGGAVKCWGYGDDGEMGNGTEVVANPVPVSVSGISGAQSIAVGGYHACAAVSSGITCWGRNVEGQIGNGSSIGTNVLTPESVVNVSGSVQALAAGDLHTCARAGGTTKCWGDNSSGQLGNGTTNDSANPVPVDVSGGYPFLGLAGGSDSTCGRTSTGVRCWGSNSSGQLGDGTLDDRNVPTEVLHISADVFWNAVGQLHACAVVGKLVMCWGENGSGELGDGTSGDSSPTPVIVSGLGGQLLDVSKVGDGSGTVKSKPSGINCGSTCAATFEKGASVTLTADPVSGSLFSGWSGDCSGSGNCNTKLSKARSVTAGFDKIQASSPTKTFTDDFEKKGDSAPHAFLTKNATATVLCKWKNKKNKFDLAGFSYEVGGGGRSPAGVVKLKPGKFKLKKSAKNTSVTAKVTLGKTGGVVRFVVVAKKISGPAEVTTTVKR